MDEFKNVIEQLIGLFKQLTKIEQVKLNAVAGKHVGTVEDCVTQQQALLLKLRGLEQARERAQKKPDMKGCSSGRFLRASRIMSVKNCFRCLMDSAGRYRCSEK